jgi:hypothetical protein
MSASPFDDARLKWRKAARSTGSGQDCVEVAQVPGLIGVRDSKHPTSPALAIDAVAWRAFTVRVKTGDLDA